MICLCFDADILAYPFHIQWVKQCEIWSFRRCGFEAKQHKLI